jgi:hypothetical protein
VRRQRRQDVLHRAVLVDVPATPSVASSRTSSASAIVPLKIEQRQPAFVDLADRRAQVRRRARAAATGRAQQVDVGQVGAYARQQLAALLTTMALCPAFSTAVRNGRARTLCRRR